MSGEGTKQTCLGKALSKHVWGRHQANMSGEGTKQTCLGKALSKHVWGTLCHRHPAIADGTWIQICGITKLIKKLVV